MLCFTLPDLLIALIIKLRNLLELLEEALGILMRQVQDEVTDSKHFAYEKIKPPNIKHFSFSTPKDMQVNVKWGLLPVPRLHS